MGSASSKAARQFPKAKPQPHWAGARTPAPGEPGAAGHQPPGPKANAPRASETRTEDIERDARDPQFMANLSKLGPVRVDHHMRTYQLGQDRAQQVARAQREAEDEAFGARPAHNRVHASMLQELLEERKAITSVEELEELCRRNGIDVAKLESIGRFVTSPSIDPASVRREKGEDGVERTVVSAAWVDPPAARRAGPFIGSST